MKRALAIVDGEHYPPVVRDALTELPHDVVAVLLVGGSEKLRGVPDYGVPLATDLDAAIAAFAPDLVIDLSDEPVLGPVARFRLAARVLAVGLPYEGPDFRLDPPELHPFAVPSLSVVGTGKRVGKTAVTGAIARRAARDRRVVVVAMGRGGPAEPEVVQLPPTLDSLIALSRAGRHAASDHLETAIFAGVPTVGCRRCGGGLAGAVGVSTVADGAELARTLDPELVIFDGSGAALPPIRTEARALVASAEQDRAVLTGYLNPYRALIADVVLLTMPDEHGRWRDLASELATLVRPGVPVIPVVLRPEPAAPIAGERVAYFCTTDAAVPSIARDLADRHGARPVHVSGALAQRDRLRAELATVDAETFVIELKAAAVDVVVEEAISRGVRVVLAMNDVFPADGHDLAAEFDRLLAIAHAGARDGGEVPA